MFTMRGWLLTIVLALLAEYYTNNIAISEVALRIALPVVALLFCVIESRHANLVEAVVERAAAIETAIEGARQPSGQVRRGWDHGPKEAEVCEEGGNRWWAS